MKKKTVTEIDYYEFEQLVKKTYGITNYSFPAVEECGNDSSHSFAPEKIEPLEDYDQEQIDELIAGKMPLYANHVIFQDFVNKGVLEPGEYIVEVCW